MKAVPWTRSLLFHARLGSFLGLFCVHLAICLGHILFRYSFPGSREPLFRVAMFNFIGIVFGSFLFPLFLPVPKNANGVGKRNTVLPVNITVIALVILPNVFFRSLGVELWAASWDIRAVIAFFTGMAYPLCCGLFFLSWIWKPHGAEPVPGAGRLCPLFFSLAMGIPLFVYYFAPVLMRTPEFTSTPAAAMKLAFKIWTLVIGGIGVCSILCAVLLNQGIQGRAYNLVEHPRKTNWSRIFALLGIAVVFKMLNAVLEMRLFIFMNFTERVWLEYVLVIAALSAVGFLAGRSIDRFLKGFLPALIIFFILFPSLFLFNNNFRIAFLTNILSSIFLYSSWVVFAVALVECYSGGFWFYLIASAMHITTTFSFVGVLVFRSITSGAESKIMVMGIAAVLLLFLAFRVLFPKTPKNEKPVLQFPDYTPLEDVFRSYKLTKMEKDVAVLMVREGLDNEAIADRLLRATVTIKMHISSIYRKFGVKGRGEFMSLFVRK